MKTSPCDSSVSSERRSFIKKGLAAGAAGASFAYLTDSTSIFAQDRRAASSTITQGDAALLRFAAAAKILESDFWVQYNELGGDS